MTQPTPYVREGDFSDDEASSVAGRSTVLTAQLDAELDAIGTTLSEVLANLALIQRDDTKLSNDSVHKDALDETVLGLIVGTGTPRGDHATATDYVLKDIVTKSSITYICAVAHTSGVFATDLASGYWLALAATYAIDVETKATEAASSAAAASTSEGNAAASAAAASTSEGNAAASAAAADTSETNAAASAALAEAAASSIAWRDVAYKTFADSPITLTAADNGTMLSIDASGGNVIVNIPSIAGLDLTNPFAIGAKKTDSGTNTITVTPDGTDTIDSAASKALGSQNAGVTLVADADATPDDWLTLEFGAGAYLNADNAWAGDNDYPAAAGGLTRGGVEVATTDDVDSGGVPIGGWLAHSGTTAPSGFLAAPLAATDISRTTYADLFAEIGTTWGAGDGSTTFGMPYLAEGETPVGANANVGAVTVGQVIAHTHQQTVRQISGIAHSAGGGTGADGTSPNNTSSTGGTKNLAAGPKVLWCIRY